jgi:DNA-binding PadR family transcriptional regulator
MAAVGTERRLVTGSPLRGALLALLLSERTRGPLGGYRLATLVERRLGPAWRVTRQSVYGALERLEEEGVVASINRDTAAAVGSGQRVYAATAAAPAVLEDWMRKPVSREPVRVELQAKIAVSQPEHAPHLLEALDEYERDCFELLRKTKEAEVAPGSWAALAMNLTRAAVDEGIQAELRWVAVARRWINDFVESRPPDHAR